MGLDYEKRDGVANITLNNPSKANILDKRPPERRIGRSDVSRAAQMLSQAALWSAKKLSGGSASSGVNRKSKRNRVAQ